MAAPSRSPNYGKREHGAWAQQASLAEPEPPPECRDAWLRPGPQLYLVPRAGQSSGLGQHEGAHILHSFPNGLWGLS